MTEQMQAITPQWHEFSQQLNYNNGLGAYFAAASLTDPRGSLKREFTHEGDRWTATLYSQESGIMPPSGETLPTETGSSFEFQNVREYRIAIDRHPDEDESGEQGLNAHLRPRWQGMKVKQDDGTRTKLSIPDEIDEGMNVRLKGSNVDAMHYQYLLRDAARALDINPEYFTEPLDSSQTTNAARYVRIHEDASGPIHARDGPIAQLGHLLENDRQGFRQVRQNDDDNHGRNIPGFRHATTLGPVRVREAFPSHSAPVEIKHYYAREALSMDEDHPLRHPKLEVGYRKARWDESFGVSDEDIQELKRQLDRSLHAVLDDAGLTLTPPTSDGEAGPPYVPDAYFSGHLSQHYRTVELNLTRIRNEQESIVIRELHDGVSPVQGDIFEYLVTDGGEVSPADIADEHNRHVGSVRRALRKMDDMVQREYGKVSLSSPHIADMVHDAVEQMREASETLTETAGKALISAEKGLDDATSALMTWCAKHGVEVDNRGEAIEEIRLGKVERRGPPGTAKLREVILKLREGLQAWEAAGRDPGKYRKATVQWREDGRGTRTMKASNQHLLG